MDYTVALSLGPSLDGISRTHLDEREGTQSASTTMVIILVISLSTVLVCCYESIIADWPLRCLLCHVNDDDDGCVLSDICEHLACIYVTLRDHGVGH